MSGVFLIFKELFEKLRWKEYEHGFRGTIGSSLVAYLCGLTNTNPLREDIPLYPAFCFGYDFDRNPYFDFLIPTGRVEGVCKVLTQMTYVTILDEKAKLQKEVKDFAQGFDLPKHMAEHIYMFSGPSVPVRLRTDESMMNELVDWLGKDFRIKKMDENGNIEISLHCNEDAMFYWAMQYGPYVEIVEPERLRNRIADAVIEMAGKYGGEKSC
jgi:hypothetical protein